MLRLEASYARDLDGCYVPFAGDVAPQPEILKLNADLAATLGLDSAKLASEGAGWLTGGRAPDGAQPLAMAYAGHQFGGFSPSLGDGRALLLGEVIDPRGERHDIHLKGSGRTPFSRGGDGKAALGPVLREYLMGEAMHALGIPTTRALSASVTGETILRDTGPVPGAVLARVAASHLRVGTFQFFAARKETDALRRVLDYAVARHDPDLPPEGRALAFLLRVIDRQARLIAGWMSVGFVHGVMNTDNMTISGETIDYGPCAFLDAYEADTVFSSIDTGGRYAFGNQPGIAQWNLARLAEALLPLIDADAERAVTRATEALGAFAPAYSDAWLARMRGKLGMTVAEDGDLALAQDLYAAMDGQGVDHTRLFRFLSAVAGTGDVTGAPPALRDWTARWLTRLGREPASPEERRRAMDAVNPLYIPRNHLVEEALQAAVTGADLGPFDRLLDVLSRPFDLQPGQEAFALPAPEGFGAYRTFCGT